MAKKWDFTVQGRKLTVHTRKKLPNNILRRFYDVQSLKAYEGEHVLYQYTYEIVFSKKDGWVEAEKIVRKYLG